MLVGGLAHGKLFWRSPRLFFTAWRLESLLVLIMSLSLMGWLPHLSKDTWSCAAKNGRWQLMLPLSWYFKEWPIKKRFTVCTSLLIGGAHFPPFNTLKNDHSVIIYSRSRRSKPAWLFFSEEHKRRYFKGCFNCFSKQWKSVGSKTFFKIFMFRYLYVSQEKESSTG